MAPAIRIGTQGWNYDAWVGAFYPVATRSTDLLAVYARAFDTVEVDSTFYAIPARQTVMGWYERTPPHFRFALKLPQEVTHERRLRDSGPVAMRFFERVRDLGEKLGPILIQMGPDFGPSELPALAAFLASLPQDLEVAVEFRQRGWIRRDVLALLRDHRVALALTDGRWLPRRTVLTLVGQPTADFLYIRWMGMDRDITDYSRLQRDRTAELEAWGTAIRARPAGVTAVFGYTNNHFAGHAPASARQIQLLLGQRPVEPAELSEQMSLF